MTHIEEPHSKSIRDQSRVYSYMWYLPPLVANRIQHLQNKFRIDNKTNYVTSVRLTQEIYFSFFCRAKHHHDGPAVRRHVTCTRISKFKLTKHKML